MCRSFFFIRCRWSNPATGSKPSAVLDFHGYQATPSHQVVIRVVGPGNVRRSHKTVNFEFRDRLDKTPVSLEPLVPALDHHRAEYDLRFIVLETYAPIHIPPSEANCSSEPGVEAIQNCSGHTIKHAGVSAIDNIVDARRADFHQTLVISLIDLCVGFQHASAAAISFQHRKHLSFAVANLYSREFLQHTLCSGGFVVQISSC